MATPKDVLHHGEGERGGDRRLPVLRPAGPDAALLGPRVRAHRGSVRRRDRVRRVVDPRVPGDPGVGHAPGARPRHRVHGPVHAAPHAQHQLLREGPGDRRDVQPRPALRREEGRAVPEADRHRRHQLLGTGGGVLHLRLDPVRPEPARGLLPHRCRRRRLELGRRAGRQEPRLQAPLQGGLLPAPADGPVPGPAQRDGAEPREASASRSRCTTTRSARRGRPRSTCASTRC